MAVVIGSRIRALRRERDLDVTALARAAGLSRGYLSHVESGAAVPSIPALERLGEVLGVPVSAFFAEPGGTAGPGGQATTPQPGPLPEAQASVAVPGISSHGYERRQTVTDVQIVRSNERRSVTYATLPDHRIDLLVPDLNRAMEVMLLDIVPPDDGPRHLLHGHYGESFVFMLEGALRLTLEDQEYLLGPGDSIYFPNALRHALQLHGDRAARAIWAQSPPFF